MSLDERGLVWLTDPWVFVLAFLFVLGAVLWSHRWVAVGRMPRPRSMAVRVPRQRRVPNMVRSGQLRALQGSASPTQPTAVALGRRARPIGGRPRAA